MKILLLGATGRTGKKIVQAAVKRGHGISAIARNPKALSDFEIDILQGTPYDSETVKQAMDGCNAVINTLNVSRNSDNPWASLTAPKDLISTSASHAVQAMEKEGIKRLIALSTIGAGDSWDSLPWFMKFLVKFSNLKYAFEDHGRQERMLKESNVNYTVCRAPMLSDDRFETGAIATQPDEKPAGMHLSRASAAEFFLDIIENGTHNREILHLSNKKDKKK